MSRDNKALRPVLSLDNMGLESIGALAEYCGSSQLEQVVDIDLSNNNLSSLDANVLSRLTSLESLNLSGNRFIEFPSELGACPKLRRLALGANGIRNLKIGTEQLGELAELGLSANGLESVDPDIEMLKSLQVLDLSGNLLSELPFTASRLDHLQELIVANNPGYAPGAEVTTLRNLSLIDLRHNGLTDLPRDFGRLPDGVLLKLEGNFFPAEIDALIHHGADQVLAFVRSLRDSKPNFEAKLLLVGEGNVGKTSLVHALAGNPFVEKRPTTHGIQITDVKVVAQVQTSAGARPAGIISLRAWDFGGQEVYRVSHQFFFSQDAIYLVVWNPREGHEDNLVEAWIKRIRLRVGDHARVIIVATHGDERSPELDFDMLREKYGSMIVAQCVVDNRSGRGISELRSIIGAAASRLPAIGADVSSRWLSCRNELLHLNKGYISREQFERICVKHHIDMDEANALASLLNELGYIVHFADDPGLRGIMVLQPEWLTKAISFVLEDHETRDSGGILRHERLPDIWGAGELPYDPQLHPYFLRLMEKFDVSYRIPDKDLSLVGQLVPHSRPEIQWSDRQSERELRLICEFAEEPPGLIPWLIVRNHRFGTNVHWRYGLLLRHPQHSTEGMFRLWNPSRLELVAHGRAPGFFFDILRDTLEHLCQVRWPGLKYDLKVPCGTDGCSGLIPLRTLEAFQRQDREITPCHTCYEDINVHQALTGFEVRRAAFDKFMSEGAEVMHHNISESLITIRALFRAASQEVSDCPRLFTIIPEDLRRFDPRQAWKSRYRLTLWCEESGLQHPVGPSYSFDASKAWFAAVAPYLRFTARTIAIFAPVVGGSAAFLGETGSTVKETSELMKSIADAFNQPIASSEAEGGTLSPETGAALRKFRQLLFDLDPQREFSGLGRVLSPTGEYLWLCEEHYHIYEPGLPILPYIDEPSAGI